MALVAARKARARGCFAAAHRRPYSHGRIRYPPSSHRVAFGHCFCACFIAAASGMYSPAVFAAACGGFGSVLLDSAVEMQLLKLNTRKRIASLCTAASGVRHPISLKHNSRRRKLDVARRDTPRGTPTGWRWRPGPRSVGNELSRLGIRTPAASVDDAITAGGRLPSPSPVSVARPQPEAWVTAPCYPRPYRTDVFGTHHRRTKVCSARIFAHPSLRPLPARGIARTE